MNPFFNIACSIHCLADKISKIDGRATSLMTPDEIAARMMSDEAFRYKVYAVVFEIHADIIAACRRDS